MEKQAEIQGYDAIECLDACIKGESTHWDWGGDGFKKKEYIRYTWSITCPTSIKDVDLKTKDYMCVFNNKPTFAWTVTYELYVFYHIDSDGTLNIKSIEQKNNNALNDSFTLGIKKYLKDPEQLNEFLQSILDSRTKKGENKEATSAGAGVGALEGPLFSGEEPKKKETKEATSSSSIGQYDAPGFEDVKMKGNNPRGRGRSFKKPQLPGGKFVQVKKKCKRFPYCNQGDIKALNIFENETLNSTIEKI
jgi:hypothetical protein